MKYASDFKRTAREALRGNWKVAVLTCFVASLINATTTSANGGISLGGNTSSDSTSSDIISSEILVKLVPFLLIIISIISIYSLSIFIISGVGKLGYAKFNLNLIDQKPASFSDLFSQFNRLGSGICMTLLMGVYTILWTLLFVIPGIVKEYSYAMTPYILLENPEMTANQAITESRYMMKGNKWRLFCLEFSFIGWALLGIAPMAVSSPLVYAGTVGVIVWSLIALLSILALFLFLRPYQEVARAAFYREVSGTDFIPFNTPTQDYNSNNQ